jgi:hypothetical protein
VTRPHPSPSETLCTTVTAPPFYSSISSSLHAKKKKKQGGKRDDSEGEEEDEASMMSSTFDSLEDLEAARKSFEKMWQHQRRQESVNPADLRHYYSVLSKRHEQEIRLLRRLEFSDDAVHDLLKLWGTTIVPPRGYQPGDYEQDGHKASQVQLDVQFASAAPNTMLTLDPDYLHPKSPETQQEYEAIQVAQLARLYPGWAEPQLRLAAYHHRRGETCPAYDYALRGLEAQPYHFASSTMFLLLSIQGNHGSEVEYWERMRLPKVFGPQRSEFVRRALHECRDRFATQSSEIRKVLGPRQNNRCDIRNSKARVVVSSSYQQPSSAHEQLSPMRPDADVNSMFGGFNANNVDPWIDRNPLDRRITHSSGSPAFNDADLNPRPNFGDDHWSNNPQGVWDIHGRVRNSAASSGSEAADSISNFYHRPPPQSSSRWSQQYRTDSAMPMPPLSSPSQDELDDFFGAWQ